MFIRKMMAMVCSWLFGSSFGILLLVSTVLFACGNSEKLLVRIAELDNSTAQGTIGHVTNDVGKINCAALCDIQLFCDGIYFDQSTRACVTVFNQFTDLSTTSDLYSHFYRSKVTKQCLYSGYQYKWDLNSCLLFVDFPRLNWTDARARCQSEAGDLVVIDSLLKDTLFLRHLKVARDEFGISRWWLGASDVETEGTFKWINGQEMTYTRWKDGEPDDMNSGGTENADCVQYFHTRAGPYHWMDITCNQKLSYMCENHEFIYV